jgi:triacylglycerol lipase
VLIARLLSVALAAVILPAAHAASLPGTPAVAPPGSNDWSCHPDAAHPDPVVLVPGTFEDAISDWYALSPRIKAAGYCVYALDYGVVPGHPGVGGLGSIPESAQTLGDFVGRVLTAAHASKVLLVGFSQGGLLPRYWMRFDGGAAKTAGLVAISPSSHGTDTLLLELGVHLGLLPECAACAEQLAGSPLLAQLNAGGDVLPGVKYTVISTAMDEVVTPWQSQPLAGKPGQVTNLLLQAKCPLDLNEHVGAPVDPPVDDMVLNALANGGLADPQVRPACGALVNLSLPALARTVGTILAVLSTLTLSGPAAR